MTVAKEVAMFTIRKSPCAAAVLALLLCLSATTGMARDGEVHPYLILLPGNYAVIGQMPDGGVSYAGTAEIREAGGKLELIKTIGEQSIHATVEIDKPSPGEGEVLRIRWPKYEQSCLVSADLDNFGRLTCYWMRDDQLHSAPGLEAYFSTGAWPKEPAPLNAAGV